MKIRLSVCIPTYNRAAFIGETLESIAIQAPEDVEIVVSDNASTDNTEEIVKGYCARFPGIIYFRQPQNMGADANFMNAVAEASGEYCWLFGSDDVMRNGALKEVLLELKQDPAVILSNRMDCDYHLRPFQIRKWLKVSEPRTLFDLSTEEGCQKYFELGTSVGAAFSFLSNIVVKRNLWNEISMNPRFMTTAYSHAYKVLSVLLAGGKLLYYNNWTVYCRNGNDSFSESGYIRRVMIDIDGYSALASVLLADKPQARTAFLALLHKQENRKSLIRIAASADRLGIWPDIKERLIKAEFDKNELGQAEKVGLAWWFKPIFFIMERVRANIFLKKTVMSFRYIFSTLEK